MGTFQRGSCAPSFILLILTDGPSYGLELMKKIESLINGKMMDKAILYKTLGKLEKERKVTVTLDDSQHGPVRKYYTITETGYSALRDYEKEIRFRASNLQTFLDKYNHFKKTKGEQE